MFSMLVIPTSFPYVDVWEVLIGCARRAWLPRESRWRLLTASGEAQAVHRTTVTSHDIEKETELGR